MFGALGTLVGLVRALPQLLRLTRTADVHGVSIDTAATSSVVSFGWAAYGAMTEQWPVAVATSCSGFVFADVAVLGIGLGRRASEIRAAPLWLVVLVAAVWLRGSGGLGLLLPVSVLVGNGPQLVTAYRERDLRGLSLPTWLLSTADGVVWGAYALVAGDLAIGVFGILQIATSALIVERRWRWGRRYRNV
jgi:uncharacterized protein with PQ loop repeat